MHPVPESSIILSVSLVMSARSIKNGTDAGSARGCRVAVWYNSLLQHTESSQVQSSRQPICVNQELDACWRTLEVKLFLLNLHLIQLELNVFSTKLSCVHQIWYLVIKTAALFCQEFDLISVCPWLVFCFPVEPLRQIKCQHPFPFFFNVSLSLYCFDYILTPKKSQLPWKRNGSWKWGCLGAARSAGIDPACADGTKYGS